MLRTLFFQRLVPILFLAACTSPSATPQDDTLEVDTAVQDGRVRPNIYAAVRLEANLTALSANDREMLPLLFQAADIMDSVFWREAWGRPDSLPVKHADSDLRRFFQMNYGPWDRMNGDASFIDGTGPKPLGARFYPQDMTADEFDAWGDSAKTSPYTMVRRDGGGRLTAIPYHVYFKGPLQRAAILLEKAATLAADNGLKVYLNARAQALRTDEYRASDLAWLAMRTNTIDLIIGPIETYEDRLYGRKASHEAYVVVKDKQWSVKLERFAKYLPGLQRSLPVPAEYKREMPGSNAQLGAYDAVYYAGHANAGGKTIAVNLPNDEAIQLEKGTRRLQLKNVMQAKFDRIMAPIAKLLIAEDQVGHVTFDAFFQNVMFHEVAHGLGIKNTVNGRGKVRNALLDEASALEEGKADILGLYMVEQLRTKGEITEGEVMDNYVTFLASVFRSVRFGASDAHGRANMLRFNFLQRAGAVVRDSATGAYRVNPEKMHTAIAELSALILKLQGDGDLEGVRALMADQGAIGAELQKDLGRLKAAHIPVDVVFEQGAAVLGLEQAP